MKKQNRIVMLLLTLAILTSCTAQTEDSETQKTDADMETESEVQGTEAETRLPYDTSGLDYGGYTFKILSYDNEGVNKWTDIPNDIYAEAENGDVLNDGIYKRNLTVETELNIQLTNEILQDDPMMQSIEQTVLSGSNDVDAAFPRMYMIPQLVQKNLLYDLLSIDTFDLSMPWYDQNAISALTIYDKLFCAVSDITYFDKLSTYVTFFNQQMAADYNLGDLYAYVENSQWTMDKLLELSENVSSDLDSNGKYDENDAYGLSCQNDGVYIFLHGGNLQICDTDKDDNIVFSLMENRNVDALQKIYTVMNDSQRYFNRQTFNLDLTSAINMFNENRALFLVRPLQSLFVMRSMQSDFGILPIPMLYENQTSYGSAVNPYSATIMCLPYYMEDGQRSSEVLQYLAYESYYTITEPFYETVLGSKLIRDEKSAKMLDIAFASRVYDPGMIWNFGDIATKLLTNRDTNVVSLLKSTESMVNTAIEKLNAAIVE